MNEPLLSESEAASFVPPLRASTQVEALISNSPIAIVALDGQHRFMAANPAFVHMFGYTSDDLLAGNFDDLIAVPGMEEESRRLSRTVLQGDKVHVVTHRRRCNGTIIHVEISGIPLMEDGHLAGVYGLYQDLTERTRAEEALRAMADRVEAVQKEERRRLLRDLHDSTSQEITALLGNLNRLNSLLAGQDEAVKNLVRQTREIATQCSARIRNASTPVQPAEREPLTSREWQVMQLLANGSTSPEIAQVLGIGVRTVESHRRNINTKYGFRRIADLVRFTMMENPNAAATHARHVADLAHSAT